jgi:hypothetical protein
MTYFTDKARDMFSRAGGDPDLSGELADWAEANAGGDSRLGVIVSEDGRILAETRHVPAIASTPGATYVTAVTDVICADTERVVDREVGLALAALRRITGGGTIHVTYWDVCRGQAVRAT